MEVKSETQRRENAGGEMRYMEAGGGLLETEGWVRDGVLVELELCSIAGGKRRELGEIFWEFMNGSKLFFWVCRMRGVENCGYDDGR